MDAAGFGQFFLAVESFLTGQQSETLAICCGYPLAKVDSIHKSPTPSRLLLQSMVERGEISPTDISTLINALESENVHLYGVASKVKEAFQKYTGQAQPSTVTNEHRAAVVTTNRQKCPENTPGSSEGSSNLDKSVSETKTVSPANFPASSEAAKRKYPDCQEKETKRKSPGQSPLQETPKSRKMPVSVESLDVPVTLAVTDGRQNHVGKGTRTTFSDLTNQGSSASKTPGSASTPSTSKNFLVSPRNTPQVSHKKYRSIASVKNCNDRNATIAVKVMKQTEEGEAKPEPGKSWHRGSYEIVDSTDRAILRVYGPQDMNFFQPRRLLLLHNVWIKEDHLAFTKLSKVEKYKGEIETLKDINKKRRFDEAQNRMTLEEIKKNAGCKAAARVHIIKVGAACPFTNKDGSKGLVRTLEVADQKNSCQTYDLVTFDKIADMFFEVQKRYQFHSITYKSEKGNFQTKRQTLP